MRRATRRDFAVELQGIVPGPLPALSPASVALPGAVALAAGKDARSLYGAGTGQARSVERPGGGD